jgi:hypothetical protein
MKTCLQHQKGACEKIALLDPCIVITALLDEKGKAVDWYVKEGTPVPDDSRSATMAMQTQIVMSIIKTGADYLGAVQYVHSKMAKMDVIHFPTSKNHVLAVVLKGRYDENAVTTKVSDFLKR